MADPDFLGMSDEDFLKESPASGEAPVVEEKTPATEEVGAVQVEEPVVETSAEIVPEKVETTAPDPHSATPDATDVQTSEASEETDDEQEGTESAETTAEAASTDYEAFYKQIMTPFKASGRTVELKTPEEAVQLMQMGANYTKKMQELAPHRKMLAMLQNNKLDEGKLSYLIDLDKKDPEAIKKLIKDSGLDPMEIDTSIEPAYREGNHIVSDESISFDQTLEDMKSTPERKRTLEVMNGDWDQASKEALWKNPEIMTIIHDQRESGVYDRINTEVNRRRILGSIPANIPFLQAYKIVGDEMTAGNAFSDLHAPVVKQPQVVATRVVAPKVTVKNGERAAAASTNRSISAKAKVPVQNPLDMSDEDFLKLDQFAGRL